MFPIHIIKDVDKNTGNVHYFYGANNFGTRISSMMGLPFFILLILSLIWYVCESIILSVVFKFVFKSYANVDPKQPPLIECIDDI